MIEDLVNESTFSTLKEEHKEVVLQLKEAQKEVENFLSNKGVVTKEGVEAFTSFEKLLRKVSEIEEFTWKLNREQKTELRQILNDATKIYNNFEAIRKSKKSWWKINRS